MFGRVTAGMDVVDAIEHVDTGPGDRPRDEVRIESLALLTMNGDAQPEEHEEIVCPHCKKTFSANLIDGSAERYRGFKCPHCRLFVPAARVDSSE